MKHTIEKIFFKYWFHRLAELDFMDLEYINTNDILSCINDANLNINTKEEFDLKNTRGIEPVNIIFIKQIQRNIIKHNFWFLQEDLNSKQQRHIYKGDQDQLFKKKQLYKNTLMDSLNNKNISRLISIFKLC